MRCKACGYVIGLMLLSSGCVQRTLNEVGRTPLTRDFTWYGTYDVQVRKEGYETLDEKTKVIAPIWQWPPFDFFVEFWPGRLKDEQKVHYTLKPASTQPVDPDLMVIRAAEMQGQLESSKYTRMPATTPAQ
jgi:hypothetical protein